MTQALFVSYVFALGTTFLVLLIGPWGRLTNHKFGDPDTPYIDKKTNLPGFRHESVLAPLGGDAMLLFVKEQVMDRKVLFLYMYIYIRMYKSVLWLNFRDRLENALTCGLVILPASTGHPPQFSSSCRGLNCSSFNPLMMLTCAIPDDVVNVIHFEILGGNHSRTSPPCSHCVYSFGSLLFCGSQKASRTLYRS